MFSVSKVLVLVEGLVFLPALWLVITGFSNFPKSLLKWWGERLNHFFLHRYGSLHHLQLSNHLYKFLQSNELSTSLFPPSVCVCVVLISRFQVQVVFLYEFNI